MAAFRRLVLTAICAGLIAGLVAAVAHQLGTVPLIIEAEAYETTAHTHADAANADWAPESGIERSLYTLAADLLAAIGFALLLGAGLALRGGGASWRQGLLWGLAGFATFTLAPGLGLPPELPGAEAAPLLERQLWWLMTAISTGSALALVAFGRRAGWMILAAGLLVLPHLVGAPQPAAASAVPAALAQRFTLIATLASLLFWLVLGAAAGDFYRRFAPRVR